MSSTAASTGASSRTWSVVLWESEGPIERCGRAREREVVFTGIGGQGIQLMAKVLAEAAAQEGKHVMLFGVYRA